MDAIINRLLDDLQKTRDLYAQQLEENKNKKGSHKSSETNDLFTALSKAQSEMGTAGLNAANPFFKSRYADLAEIIKASRPALTKYGLSVSQQLITTDDGLNMLVTVLGHTSGQWMESRVRIVPPKNDIQSLGACITYNRRFAYSSLIGVCVSDEDDDGESVVAPQRNTSYTKTSYNQPETISPQQLAQLQDELSEFPDIAEDVLQKLNIKSLAQMEQTIFLKSLKRIREIKQDKMTIK